MGNGFTAVAPPSAEVPMVEAEEVRQMREFAAPSSASAGSSPHRSRPSSLKTSGSRSKPTPTGGTGPNRSSRSTRTTSGHDGPEARRRRCARARLRHNNHYGDVYDKVLFNIRQEHGTYAQCHDGAWGWRALSECTGAATERSSRSRAATTTWTASSLLTSPTRASGAT
jgi:hypothetical protein